MNSLPTSTLHLSDIISDLIERVSSTDRNSYAGSVVAPPTLMVCRFGQILVPSGVKRDPSAQQRLGDIILIKYKPRTSRRGKCGRSECAFRIPPRCNSLTFKCPTLVHSSSAKVLAPREKDDENPSRSGERPGVINDSRGAVLVFSFTSKNAMFSRHGNETGNQWAAASSCSRVTPTRQIERSIGAADNTPKSWLKFGEEGGSRCASSRVVRLPRLLKPCSNHTPHRQSVCIKPSRLFSRVTESEIMKRLVWCDS
jgi:hypothetical protein